MDFLPHDFLAKSLKNCRCLTTECAALGHQCIVVALNYTGTASPLHSGDGVLGNINSIAIGEEVGVLAYAYIVALVLGVTIQDRRHLLTGDGIIGAEVFARSRRRYRYLQPR